MLRQAGAPESFTEPRAIYRRCRERGMDFVTISDHDSIAGALEIVHSVAHPLVRVNGRLTLAHLEKLLVLFNRFEGLNGIHDRRANDHGGFYIATTWTETPAAASVAAFLDHLRAGASAPGGETGSTLRLTQSLYAIAYEFYRRCFPFPVGSRGRKDPFARLLAALAEGPTPEPRRRFGLWGARRRPIPAQAPEAASFGFASRASEEAIRELAAGFVRELRRGRLAASVGAAAAQAAPLALACAPFLVAFHAQHRDRDLVDAAAARFLGSAAAAGTDTVAWFADAPGDGPEDAARALAASRALGRRPRGLVAIRCGRPAELRRGVPGRERLIDLGLAPARVVVVPAVAAPGVLEAVLELESVA